MPTRDIQCNFVASFKVGDNLVYNTQILCDLVQANDHGRFNKLILIQIAAILEASLSEIISRAQNFNLEGVPNISAEDQAEIRQRTVDKFYHVINILRKYEVLEGARRTIYDDLHTLRKFRNKIHIQEDLRIEDVSRDEDQIFTSVRTRWAMDLNLEVLEYLSCRLARPAHIENFVAPLSIPS